MTFLEWLKWPGPGPMVKPDEEIDQMDMETPFVYILVRNDMPKVIQLVQASHAVHESGIEFGKIGDRVSHFCVLGVKNEDELLAAAFRAEVDGFKFHVFHEPDDGVGYSAMATEPIVGERRKAFSQYKLLRM